MQGNSKDAQWYKDAIIYELHIKAFADSNQDGIGDFRGLLTKLDYLQELGVTTIWLLPFYPSPLRDDGYDIADYYSINSAYGNIDDFKEFLAQAHLRGLKVITELVLNHTSDKHPWFQRARKSPKGSDYRNYYVWSDDPAKYPDVRIIFQDFETSNWTWDPEAGQYYWHRFFSHQPDLNYDNPNVQAEVLKIIDYWCSMGVDGFRLDAIPYLFERDHTNGENLPETHAFLKDVRRHVDMFFPNTVLLAEANMWPEDSASYFGNGDECHMNYHFPLMPRIYMALQMEDRYPVIDIFDQTPDIPENCQWAIFLRNHDELTLEMVTDEERDYMYRVYVKDPKARINLGIRHRLAPLMNNNRKKIELLNYLLFSLPGTPVIYYGDEIGMGDNFYLGDRDGVRTPMQWTPGRNAGFSDSNPHRLYLPVIQDIDYHYESINVEIQNRNPSSLLWWIKRVIAKRKQYKAFGWGDIKFIGCDNAKIFAFTRTYQDETMLIVANLSRYAQPALLELQTYAGQTPIEVFSKNKFPSVHAENSYFLSLSAYECMWFLMKKKTEMTEKKEQLVEITVSDWASLGTRDNAEILENIILPGYLMARRWFGGKSRVMEAIRIVRKANVPTDFRSIAILFLEVSYQEGLPEYYQLPVAFADDNESIKFMEHCPQSIIAKLKVGATEGILYDAVFGSVYQNAILNNIADNKKIPQDNGDLITFEGKSFLKDLTSHPDAVKPRVLSVEQSNTSVIYGSHLFFKMYRKVDFVMNADVELSRFLSEDTSFTHMPAFAGTISWKAGQETLVLGMMQRLVENSGDGWAYVLGRLDELTEKMLANPEVMTLSGSLGSQRYTHTHELHPLLKELFSGPLVEQIRLLAMRTAEMHLALGSHSDMEAFAPERYSLHYQRSLYSGLKTLVRNTFQNQAGNLPKLAPDIRSQAQEIIDMQSKILEVFKNIYKQKIDVVKIRIHGDYHLGQVLFTGKDFVITDFEGEPARSYSERRLRRSPLRDVAGMIRSFHYAAYASLLLDNQIRAEDYSKLMPLMEEWYHYVSAVFLQTYIEGVKDTAYIPKTRAELDILMTTFLLEKAIYELNYELNNRPDWVIIPLNGIKALMAEATAVAEVPGSSRPK
ncbi:maltose alpha-D-glucosyltransferase [Chryseolinea sp. T2]|uniref:maltose alpha-D-glucosyltransferase n=1 Tax=Chryseolinea sp. T2 TaxID=3129255 RepID=UPI003076E038